MTRPFETNNERYPPAEVVEDFHRHSDLNQRYDSQHHSLGKGQYHAARGDHVHDGSTGVALLENDSLGGVLTNAAQLPFIIKDLITILVDRFGLEDNTTV